MFIGWHKDGFIGLLDAFSQNVVCDKNSVLKTWLEDKTISFGSYKDEELVALVGAYRFKDSILINNFSYKEDVDSHSKERLLSLLLRNIIGENKTILIMAHDNEKELFGKFGFEEFAPFYKVLYDGYGVGTFNSSLADISAPLSMDMLKKIDYLAMDENRLEYISNTINKPSSLTLSTINGYQHSYALNKSMLKISPWIMHQNAANDARKILQGLIYHRGLKRIFAFIPAQISAINDLYQEFKFEKVQNYTLMYCHKKPNIALEMVYGF